MRGWHNLRSHFALRGPHMSAPARLTAKNTAPAKVAHSANFFRVCRCSAVQCSAVHSGIAVAYTGVFLCCLCSCSIPMNNTFEGSRSPDRMSSSQQGALAPEVAKATSNNAFSRPGSLAEIEDDGMDFEAEIKFEQRKSINPRSASVSSAKNDAPTEAGEAERNDSADAGAQVSSRVHTYCLCIDLCIERVGQGGFAYGSIVFAAAPTK